MEAPIGGEIGGSSGERIDDQKIIAFRGAIVMLHVPFGRCFIDNAAFQQREDLPGHTHLGVATDAAGVGREKAVPFAAYVHLQRVDAGADEIVRFGANGRRIGEELIAVRDDFIAGRHKLIGKDVGKLLVLYGLSCTAPDHVLRLGVTAGPRAVADIYADDLTAPQCELHAIERDRRKFLAEACGARRHLDRFDWRRTLAGG